MNTKIHIKSVLVGLGAGMLVALVVAAAPSSGSSVGRYQLSCTGQNGNGSECFIIDTVTGKAWKASIPPNVGTDPDFFQPKNGAK